jgi:hypothetical protein
MSRELSNRFIAVWRPLLRLKVGVVVVRDVVVAILKRTGLEPLSWCVTPIFFVLVHGRAELTCTGCYACCGGANFRRHGMGMH